MLQKHNGIILSFGWTWQELLAGKKTVTRRLWKKRTANIFKKYYQEQKLVRAADKGLQYKGKVIALDRINRRTLPRTTYLNARI